MVLKRFIGFLHVNFEILVISFIYFLCGANRLQGPTLRLSLSHEFEQFGAKLNVK